MLHKLTLCGESLPTVPKLSGAKLFLLWREKNLHRGTYFIRDRESHHSILLLPSQLAEPSLPQQHPRLCSVCRLRGSGLGGSSALYLWLLYWRAIHFHIMGRKSLRLQWRKRKRKRKEPWLVTILRALFHSFYTAQILAIRTEHRSSCGLF